MLLTKSVEVFRLPAAGTRRTSRMESAKNLLTPFTNHSGASVVSVVKKTTSLNIQCATFNAQRMRQAGAESP
jgi:hypothetical protein